jgi:hypothetical protein
MSAGSSASNLGYSRIFPNSGIDGNFLNVGSSNNPMFFSSNQIPGAPGLSGAKNNVDAAEGKIYNMNGGTTNLKRKIKNITKKYKMNKKSLKRKASTLRRKIKKRLTKSRSRRYRQRGGYSQYQNNLPLTPSYSTGGQLAPSNSALANPVPYHIKNIGGNCTDNYNHYTGKGFASKGH